MNRIVALGLAVLAGVLLLRIVISKPDAPVQETAQSASSSAPPTPASLATATVAAPPVVAALPETPNSEPPRSETAKTEIPNSIPSGSVTMNNSYNPLTQDEKRVILYKGTEYGGTGEYEHNKAKGTYLCRQCNNPLYTSDQKFDSRCGWPSFEDELPGAVTRNPDPDGQRTEIVCSNCEGHLGHVFIGEFLTAKNTRHCVNSISMKFYAAGEELPKPIVLPKK